MAKVMKLKYLYLLFLFIFCLMGVALVPTYAKFASNYATEDDMVGLSLNFDLNISNIEEYEEVVVGAHSTFDFNIEIKNSSDAVVYYGVWYQVVEPLEFLNNITIMKSSSSASNTSGAIRANGVVTVGVSIVNNGNSEVKVNIGVANSDTGVGDIEYLGGKYLIVGNNDSVSITHGTDDLLLTDYIEQLYFDGGSIQTVYVGGDDTKPRVSLNSGQGIMLDNNGSYRYYGANPSNYIQFNDELWRIISVSNVESSIDDTVGTMRVKIIRDEVVGSYSYDSSVVDIHSGYGVNHWIVSDLNSELNTLYYDRKVGNCYNGQGNIFDTCDFTNIGLSEEAKSFVGEALYYLGGVSASEDLYASDYYAFERGNVVYDCSVADGACPRAVTWTGIVGLMYASDYAYAADLSLCTKTGFLYHEATSCTQNDWLLDLNDWQWTMTPSSFNGNSAFAVGFSGILEGNTGYVSNAWQVRPVVYLNEDVLYISGDGSRTNPYIVSNG